MPGICGMGAVAAGFHIDFKANMAERTPGFAAHMTENLVQRTHKSTVYHFQYDLKRLKKT